MIYSRNDLAIKRIIVGTTVFFSGLLRLFLYIKIVDKTVVNIKVLRKILPLWGRRLLRYYYNCFFCYGDNNFLNIY